MGATISMDWNQQTLQRTHTHPYRHIHRKAIGLVDIRKCACFRDVSILPMWNWINQWKIIKRNKNDSKCNKPTEANNDFMFNYVKSVFLVCSVMNIGQANKTNNAVCYFSIDQASHWWNAIERMAATPITTTTKHRENFLHIFSELTTRSDKNN